jgi:GTP cyclohydrolase I
MADHDPILGKTIHEYLKEQNLESPLAPTRKWEDVLPYDVIAKGQQDIMTELGLDLRDDSLKDTPKRVAKMYTEELFYGLDYNNFPKCTTFENRGQYDELVATTVTVHSFCEHHFLPFIGRAHVAYIPGGRYLGLSKFSRIVDFFSRRPQVQERLTVQISAALRHILDTEDVAVVIQAEHFCATMRGVKDSCGETHTSKLMGRFRTVPELRNEFLALTRQ